MAIADIDFDYVRWLVETSSAIVLESNKKYLVETRLSGLARREGYTSVSTLISELRGQPKGPLYRKVVEAMCTHETTFFRDIHPFEAVRGTLIPALIERRRGERSLNILSAACSSGQEAYSLAMLLRESFPELSSWRVRITGTDISTDILQKAKRGRYSQLEVNRGLPASHLVKYFERVGLEWQIKDGIRQMVDWREVNLAGTWPLLPAMDIIFLRNVMIYFGMDTKREILGKMRRQIRSDGYLFLGAAETTHNLDDAYERLSIGKAWCYQLKRGG